MSTSHACFVRGWRPVLSGVLLCLLVGAGRTAWAVDVGWKLLEDGGFEYTIQIPPELLPHLREGETLESFVPPEIEGQIRRYRITVGDGDLPRDDADQTESETISRTTRYSPYNGATANPNSRPPDPVGQSVPLMLPPTPPPSADDPPRLPDTAGQTLASDPMGRETPAGRDVPVTPGPAKPTVPDAGTTPGKDKPEPVKEKSEEADSADTGPQSGFIALAVVAIAAVAGMFYTGMLAWDYRNRYLRLLKESLRIEESENSFPR